AAFVIPSSEGLILIESGPYSTFASMKEGLARLGYAVEDVKHLLLTHIHFDHAGAAWAFAKAGTKVYLHPFGERHMQDPSKLVASATMIYGDQMDTLWGDMQNIELENLRIVSHQEQLHFGDVSLKALHTPGHAKHHIAWKYQDCIFTGDVAGVKIEGGPVVPPCPPPDINLENWKASIQLLKDENPKELVLTHFGAIAAVNEHLEALEAILNDWSLWIKEKWEAGLSNEDITPLFMEYTNQQLSSRGVSTHGLKQYEAANPAWMSVAGLVRYWKKKMQE
ncbi:MAG: MBL fold metallo-hydrolase, partial [Bacteroidota bacterium]